MARPEQPAFSKSPFLFADRIALEDLPERSLVRMAHKFWRGLTPEPDLPARSDFDASDVPRKIMPWVFLHEVVRHDDGTLDYRCKLMGTSTVAMIGFDPTGHLNTEYYSQHRPSAISTTVSTRSCVRAVLHSGKPAYRTPVLKPLPSGGAYSRWQVTEKLSI